MILSEVLVTKHSYVGLPAVITINTLFIHAKTLHLYSIECKFDHTVISAVFVATKVFKVTRQDIYFLIFYI